MPKYNRSPEFSYVDSLVPYPFLLLLSLKMNELHLILIAFQNWRGSGGESAKLFSRVSTDRKHGNEPEVAQTGYLE